MKKLLLLFICIAASCQSSIKNKTATYDIKEFFDNVNISGGYFSSSEEKMIYSTNKSGIVNVYEVELTSKSVAQLSFSEKESFYVRSYVPNSDDFIYSADKGGNEISHLYLQKRSGETLDLTPGINEKSIFYGWSQDKTFLYYLSNKRDSRYFDLYKMKIDEWEPEMIYENKDNFSLSYFNGTSSSSISNNEHYLLLTKAITTSENKFYLLDQIQGQVEEISTLPGRYTAAGFSKDNKSFYYITDIEKEFAYLNKYDIQTGESTVVFQTNWDVMYSYSSKNEQFRIIGINEDGKNSIQVIDNNSKKPIKFPSFKDADITGVEFSESENKIRFSVGSSKTPNNLFLYDLRDESLVKLTNSLNPVIDSKSLVAAEVIRYTSFDNLEIPAIFYKPLNASPTNKVPALVWVHGGPGGQSRMNFNPLIQYLTNNGYAILAVNNNSNSSSSYIYCHSMLQV